MTVSIEDAGRETAQADERSLLELIAGERAEQQTAIRPRRKLTVVSAGAGTGKTHTLARRFAWLLATDPTCRVEQILTLTFTQLAANEMRERIKNTLREWYESRRDSLPHLRDAIDRIDEAYISTIHSFAMRVIRESGLELDIDPASSLIGESVESEFWEDYRWSLQTLSPERAAIGLNDDWRARVEEMMSSSFYAPLLNCFGSRTLARLAGETGELFGSMNFSPSDLLSAVPDMEKSVRRRMESLLSSKWSSAWELWQDKIFPAIGEKIGSGKEGAFQNRLCDLRAKWSGAEANTPREKGEFLAGLVNCALSSLPGRSKLKSLIEDEMNNMKLVDWRNEHKEAADLTSTLFEPPAYSEEEALARRMLILSAAAGWESWNSARLRMGGLSYADLVLYASRVLHGSGDYAKRFRHVMIDEFQDTDGLQNAMLTALSSGIADGTLFIVGDIKQSIYRFRHADPKLFARCTELAVRGDAAGEAIHIPLSCSYRMSGAMMDAINRIFGRIWRDGVIGSKDGEDGLRIGYEPLLPPSDAPWWSERNGEGGNAHDSPVEIILYSGGSLVASLLPGDGTAPKMTVGEKRRILADALAIRMRAMVNGEMIWDKGEKRFRPMSWRDIAILVPSRAPYRVLEESLEAFGIPVVFERGMEYFNRGEVLDLVNCLRALDDPSDEHALAGWLESPFSGVKPGAALELVSAARGDGLTLWSIFSERFAEPAARFMGIRRRARLAGPSFALSALLEELSWLSAYRSESRLRVLANVRRGMEMARDYESSFGMNLAACADYLRRSAMGGSPVEEPEFARDGDFVRVKTVHASKGQEFPVVLLMGMETALRSRARNSASASRHLGVVAKNLPVPCGDRVSFDTIESVTSKWHSFLEALEEGEEKERLMYVAMTRAQERLLCCAVHDGERAERGRSWMDWLLCANEDSEGKKIPVTFVDDPPAPPGRKKPAKAARIAGETPVFHKTDNITLAKMSATSYSLFSWCPMAYRMRYRQGRKLKWEMPDGDGYGGADMGSLAHWVLARWNMTPAGIDRFLPLGKINRDEEERNKRDLPPYLRPVFAKPMNREHLRSWLLDFASTDECAELMELLSRGLLQRELEFSVPFGATKLVGGIDLYWEDEDGCHVRDWKITLVDRAPDELYREQVNFYALACGIARGQDKVDAGLIYLRPGKSQGGAARRWMSDDLKAIGSGVLDAAKIAATGPFEAKKDRCRRCPFISFCGARTHGFNLA
jgi:ATP-dependent exoDNAse (exonuclease V) beta subunit